MSDDVIFHLIPFAFMLVGAVIFWAGMVQRRKGIASLSWPTVEGRVISSGIESAWSRDSDNSSYLTYYAAIRYEYTVGDRTYAGDQTKVGGEIRTTSSVRAGRAAARYREGAAVTVHYDPIRPEEAVLEPGVKIVPWVLVIFGLLFIATGVIVMLALGS